MLNNAGVGDIIDEMVRITRPGGWVALQDLDKLAWACEPAHPAWDRILDAFRAARAAAGYDEYVGRRLPGLLRARGLHDVGFDVHARVWDRPEDPNKTKLVHFARVLREPILASGRISAEQLDQDVPALAEHLSDPDTFVVNALMAQAWGRVPR